MKNNEVLTEQEVIESNRELLDFIQDNQKVFDIVDAIKDRVNSQEDLEKLTAREFGILQSYISMLADPICIRELKYAYAKKPTGYLKKVIWLCSIPELQTCPDDDGPQTH